MDAAVAVEAVDRSWINTLRDNALATQFFDTILQQATAGFHLLLSENPLVSVGQSDQVCGAAEYHHPPSSLQRP